MVAAELEVIRRTRRGWTPARREFARWRDAALGRRARGSEICVLLVGRVRARALNRGFRGRDYPTNVLSFPAVPLAGAAGGQVRGDLVICPDVLRRESRRQGKSERAHWAHLFVHGVLHLAGYDHQRRRDALRMERREVRVLHGLGIANPYRETGSEPA